MRFYRKFLLSSVFSVAALFAGGETAQATTAPTPVVPSDRKSVV